MVQPRTHVTVKNSLCIALLLLTVPQTSWSQAVDFPKDTSYSIRSATEKMKKDYPFVTPIAPVVSGRFRADRDVVYADVNGRELHLDIFYPTRKKRKGAPGVLMIHGGGWRSGTKANQVPMAQRLAENGYVAIAVEYRLSLEAPYPAAVHDLKAALRWMRANAANYGLDPGRIAALGCSAGAQLAALLGTTNGMPGFEGAAGNAPFSSAVQAVVNIDGIVSFIHPEASAEGAAAGQWLGGSRQEAWENWKEASPLEYVNAQTPPFLFINSSIPRFHAGRDDLIAKLSGFGIYSQVHTLPDSPHSFWLAHPWFEPTLDYVKAFLDKIFR